MTKYALYDNGTGLILKFFPTLKEAQDFLKILVHFNLPKDGSNPTGHNVSILEVKEVYTSDVIDETQDSVTIGYVPSKIEDAEFNSLDDIFDMEDNKIPLDLSDVKGYDLGDNEDDAYIGPLWDEEDF